MRASAPRRALRTEIIVVSGLPRSGTSLMMGMLAAGGVELVTDGARKPDVDNPLGYFELERVRALATDSAWLESARGKAVKVISALLEHLPPTHRYKVLFMQRDLDEILESQARMLEHRAVPRARDADPGLRAEFAAHLAATDRLLRENAAFDVRYVSYRSLLESPDATIAEVTSFLGAELDRIAMRGCVDPALYRVRSAR